MHHNESGMTLLEILIAVVITTIVMIGSYATYNMVSKQYSSITDRSQMRQSGRKAIDVIVKDLRNAGYYNEGSGCSVITKPISSYDNKNAGTDELEIIYDISSTERRKISYLIENKQLYKKISTDKNTKCNPSNLLYSKKEDQLLIKNVEDLQFEGVKDGKAVHTCGADIINIFLTVKSNKEHGKETI